MNWLVESVFGIYRIMMRIDKILELGKNKKNQDEIIMIFCVIDAPDEL